VAERAEPAVTPLERAATPEPETEPELESESERDAATDAAARADGPGDDDADADTASRPEDDEPVASPDNGRVDVDPDPGVPRWFDEALRVDGDSGRTVAGGTAVGEDLRATRRAAIESARARLAASVGEAAAASALADRGGVYPVEGGFRVYILLSAATPGDTED